MAASTSGSEPPPPAADARSAYIHVPFCVHRCGYCNFTLVAGRDDLVGAYLEAIEIELARLEQPRAVDTLFLGGGTPTHLPPQALTALLRLVGRWHPLAEGGEFSCEANPLDVTAEKVALLRAAGVNRLSLGVQSFDDAKLAVLERDHRQEQLERAIALARENFESFSIDLIFGAPGETLEVWRDDLRRAIACRPTHVSTYGLTFEKGTQFWSRREKGELAQQDEETERAMYEEAIQQLTAAGYEHYEVSNFALPGSRCRHNEVYWTGRPFYAAGPGAASYQDHERRVNHRSTTTWIKRLLAGESSVAESERLAPQDRARERVVFGLRRMEGIDLDALREEFEFDVEQLIARPLEEAVRLGLLERQGQRVRLTHEGLLVSDALWGKFL